MGYYPATLFSRLNRSANFVACGGEIYSGLPDPADTKDQMGSGRQAAAGFQHAAYLRNLRNQTTLGGTMADSAGVAAVDTPGGGISSPYTIDLSALERTWGSHMFVGGPIPPNTR